MASRVCPYCQGLNGQAEVRCYRCGRKLPGPLQTQGLSLVREVLGSEAPMTRLIIGIEVLIFALCLLVEGRIVVGLGDGFSPSTLLRFGALFGPALDSEPWRLLSAVFVHGGILHVGMNLMMFAWLGPALERELGAARAVLVFLGSGVIGFLGTSLWMGERAFSVGASGGVFGQIGAFVGILLARRDPAWKKALARSLIYALLITLAIARVDTAAHLGGLVGGALLGFALYKEQLRLRLHRAATVLAALGIAASIASVALSSLSPYWKAFRTLEMQRE